MKKVLTTPEARFDLKSIAVYTDKKWGRRQRIIYLQQLTDRFSRLAENPKRYTKRDDITGSPYSYHEGRHVIFYRIQPEGVEILRVMHDSMDFPRHFK